MSDPFCDVAAIKTPRTSHFEAWNRSGARETVCSFLGDPEKACHFTNREDFFGHTELSTPIGEGEV